MLAQPQKTTQNIPVPQAFAAAQQKHAAGDVEVAVEIYRRILGAVPDHAEAVVMLASIAYRQGRDEEAQALLDRAIDLTRHAVQRMPDEASPRASLINLLLARGRVGEAEAAIQELELTLNPIRATPKAFAARREAVMADGVPPVIISTLPKSASESIWNKLAEGLGLAQCYLSLGLFPDCCLVPSRVAAASQGGVAVKEHIAPTEHNRTTLQRYAIDRLVVHHRDPRQATLSWAHFARDDINRRLMAPLWRKIVPPAEILDRDLGGQIDWCIEAYMPRLIDFLAGWRRVDEDPEQPLSVLFLSFEQFRTDPASYFDRLLDFYGIARERFAAEAAAEVVHMRKGQVDEWRSVFNKRQRGRAWDLIPDDMAAAFEWEP